MRNEDGGAYYHAARPLCSLLLIISIFHWVARGGEEHCPAGGVPLTISSDAFTNISYLWRDCLVPIHLKVLSLPSHPFVLRFDNVTLSLVTVRPFLGSNGSIEDVTMIFSNCLLLSAVDIATLSGSILRVSVVWMNHTRVVISNEQVGVPHCTYCVVSVRQPTTAISSATGVTLQVLDTTIDVTSTLIYSGSNLFLFSQGTFADVVLQIIRSRIAVHWPPFIAAAIGRSPFVQQECSTVAVVAMVLGVTMSNAQFGVEDVTWAVEASGWVTFFQFLSAFSNVVVHIRGLTVASVTLAGPMTGNGTVNRNFPIVTAPYFGARSNVTVLIRDVVFLNNASYMFTNFEGSSTSGYEGWGSSASPVLQYSVSGDLVFLQSITNLSVTVTNITSSYSIPASSATRKSWAPTSLTQGYLFSIVSLLEVRNATVYVADSHLSVYMVGELCPETQRLILPILSSASTFFVVNIRSVNVAGVNASKVLVERTTVAAWITETTTCIGAAAEASFLVNGVVGFTARMVSRAALALAIASAIALPDVSFAQLFADPLPDVFMSQITAAGSSAVQVSRGNSGLLMGTEITVDSCGISRPLSNAMLHGVTKQMLFRSELTFSSSLLSGATVNGAPSTLTYSDPLLVIQGHVTLLLMELNDVMVTFRRGQLSTSATDAATSATDLVPVPCYVLLGNSTIYGRLSVSFRVSTAKTSDSNPPTEAAPFPSSALPSMWLMLFACTTLTTDVGLIADFADLWSPSNHLFWDSLVTSFNMTVPLLVSASRVSYPVAPLPTSAELAVQQSSAVFSQSLSPLIRLVDAISNPASLQPWRISNIINLSCTMRDGSPITARRVGFPPNLVPRQRILYHTTRADACVGAPEISATELVVQLSSKGVSRAKIPLAMEVAVAVSYGVPHAGAALAAMQSTGRALKLLGRCDAPSSDGTTSGSSGGGGPPFLSDPMDNPFGWSITQSEVVGSDDVSFAMGSVVGNVVLIVLVGAAVSIAAVGGVVAMRGWECGDGSGHDTTGKRVSAAVVLRAAKEAFWEHGGWVSAFATAHCTLTQPLAAAAGFLFCVASTKEYGGTIVEARGAIVSAGIAAGVAVVAPLLFWLLTILVSWQRVPRFPFVLKRELSSHRVHHRGRMVDGLFPCWQGMIKLKSFIQRMDQDQLGWLPRQEGRENVGAFAVFTLSPPELAFLPIFEPFRATRVWYFLVDASVNIICGVVGGVAMAYDSGDTGCQWSVWALLSLNGASVLSALLLRPHLSRLELASSVACGALGCISIALALAHLDDVVAELAIVTCVVGLVLPLFATLRGISRFFWRVGRYRWDMVRRDELVPPLPRAKGKQLRRNQHRVNTAAGSKTYGVTQDADFMLQSIDNGSTLHPAGGRAATSESHCPPALSVLVSNICNMRSQRV